MVQRYKLREDITRYKRGAAYAEVKGGEGWVKGSFHPFTALNIYGSTI